MLNGQEKLAKNWKDVAAEIYSSNLDLNSGQIHRELVLRLGEGKAPGLNAVQKWRHDRQPKKKAIQDSGLESPWHMGLMGKHDIVPDAIPFIMLVQSWCNEKHDIPLFVKGQPVSIREALWISRLHALAKGFRKAKGKQIDIAYWLWAWSRAYARYELICELTPGDTAHLDGIIAEHGLTAVPISGVNAVDIWFSDGHIKTIIEKEIKKDGEA